MSRAKSSEKDFPWSSLHHPFANCRTAYLNGTRFPHIKAIRSGIAPLAVIQTPGFRNRFCQVPPKWLAGNCSKYCWARYFPFHNS